MTRGHGAALALFLGTMTLGCGAESPPPTTDGAIKASAETRAELGIVKWVAEENGPDGEMTVRGDGEDRRAIAELRYGNVATDDSQTITLFVSDAATDTGRSGSPSPEVRIRRPSASRAPCPRTSARPRSRERRARMARRPPPGKLRR
jgi:hypothetical protein